MSTVLLDDYRGNLARIAFNEFREKEMEAVVGHERCDGERNNTMTVLVWERMKVLRG